MKRSYPFVAAAFALLAAPTMSHAAVNCVVSGKMQVEPQDRFYCDATHLNCAGWNQVDLDLKRGAALAAPLRYMRVSIWSTTPTLLATRYTDSAGNFSATVSMPGASCAGQTVRVQRDFVRIHESDGALAAPRARFRIIDNTANRRIQAEYRNVPLTGPTTDGGFRQPWNDVTSNGGHWANVFYTMDAAINEVRNWNTTLNSRLTYTGAGTAQAFIVDSTFTGTSNCRAGAGQDGTVSLKFSSYATGGEIRHEFGHWVQAAMHNFGQHSTCLNYTYGGDNVALFHSVGSCEYGYAANKEAIANFIAVRSITTADKNAWYCGMGTAFGQDKCSSDVKDVVHLDPDGDGVNGTAPWAILGDDFATNVNTCTGATANCGCNGANQPSCFNQAFRNSNGFRNEVQPARFYWDLLDTNNEGTDDIDVSMGDIVLAFMGMAAGTANRQYDEAGTSLAACLPEQANVRDYAAAVDTWLAANVPGRTTSAERTLNCVSAGVPL